ncbi:MAG TPA: efflux RND transporter permease subunit [Thermoanaerobaculia bacterium]|jgi:HAE1 family hydrophobic/amphiphilic exporter-1|nr:efflux RND transporter permease subunit [Thermoanaerobaculia bacterium]
MTISDFAIERPIVTVVTMLALVIFGIFALFNLEVDEFPDLSNPIVFVSVPYPGASPSQVEQEVVERLEEAFGALSGVDEIRSTSLDGFATIIVQFVFSKDPDQATQDVRDAISGIRADLPQEMEEPILRKFDPGDLPIVSLVLASTQMAPPELTLLADPGITRALRGINGVAQVTVVGGVEREISVDVRPADMAAAGVTIAQVVQAVQAQNLAAPVGRIEGRLTEQAIRLRGRLETPEEFAQLVVSTRNGRVVRLGQVASVRDGTAEQRSLALFNGQPAVGIDITKSKGASTTRVADDVKTALARIQKTLPPGVKLSVVRDAGERVRNSVRNVEEALIEGAILTVLVVFLFLNSWRSTVITGLALPVSVLSSFIAVWAFGFTLNTMSLLGLSLAIGILIDDAIVVRENIVRHVEMGKDHVKASHEGTREIALAVAATTFSIVAVFAPIAFMQGVAGQWFKPFALTIACSVLVSLFVSFSLDPMLSAYWPDPQIEAHERRNPIARALDRFNAWFDRQAERYKGVIAWALDHRLAVIGIVVVSFFGAIALQALFGGGGFIPESDRSEITLSLETPPGSNLNYSAIKARQLSDIARSHEEVAYTYTSVGSSNGSGGVDTGSVYIKLVPKHERDISQRDLARQIRQEMRRIGGVTAYLSQGGPGGNQKQIQIQIRGQNMAELNRAALQIENVLRKVKGATDIGLSTRGQRPELEVRLNRGLAGSLGLNVGQVAQSLRPAFAGIDAGDWIDPLGKTRDVTVRLAPEARENLTDIERLPLVVGAGGGAVAASLGAGTAGASAASIPASMGTPSILPLGQVATITRSVGPAQIDHLDRDKVVTVGANVEGASLSEVSRAVNRQVARLQLPPGAQLSQGGEVENQNDVFTKVFAALALAVLLMYLILVMQFGSFLDPLAILLSLPLSLVGVVLMLLITGDTLNIMSLIGVILLMGIVAKNAILLIDFAKWNHEEGMPLRDALIEAGRVRLRPILMTTVALIAGMIPVALGLGEGADFRAPLGRAVIGGTITSTFLTLLVIPTVYEIMVEWREKIRGLFRRKTHVRIEGAAGSEPAGVGRG